MNRDLVKTPVETIETIRNDAIAAVNMQP